MTKEKIDSKARAGHLALHFEKVGDADGPGAMNAVLAYQDGGRTRQSVLGTVAPDKASSDFGDIACWGFTPAATVSRAVKIDAFKKKTAREVKLGVSEALFLALVGPAENVLKGKETMHTQSRVQGGGTAA